MRSSEFYSVVQCVSGVNRNPEKSSEYARKYAESIIFKISQAEAGTLKEKSKVLLRTIPRYSLGVGFWKWIELCKRGFSNTFRDPGLLYYSYGISILVGIILGLIFMNFDNGIAGIQNRVS